MHMNNAGAHQARNVPLVTACFDLLLVMISNADYVSFWGKRRARFKLSANQTKERLECL